MRMIGQHAGNMLRLLTLGLIGVFSVTPPASATVHVVQFGGTVGLSYSPGSFQAEVGDTVRWEGNFSFHPLSSTAIPAGAAAWHNGAGTSFEYVITVAGDYSYQCDAHQPTMAGSFSAGVTGVEEGSGKGGPMTFRLAQNYPNPFNPSTVIGYRLPAVSDVQLAVYDMLGRRVAVLLNERQGEGEHRVQFDGSGLASGIYEYRLTARRTDGGQSDAFTQTKRMVLAR